MLILKKVKQLVNFLILHCKQVLFWIHISKLEKSPEFQKDSIALMTVFILRENILFLEEWIEHHLKMGIDHFVLYDNSKVQRTEKNERYKNVNPGSINKHNQNYSKLITQENAEFKLNDILNKYGSIITIIPWTKKDKNGKIGYFQIEAINDFIKRYKRIYDYALLTDMDEFMVSRTGFNLKDLMTEMKQQSITSIYFKSRIFSSRFNYIGRSIRKISKCLPHDREDEGFKTMFKLSAVISANVHCTKTLFKNKICPNDKMLMYHYCYNYEGAGTKLINSPEVLKYIKQ